METIQGDLFSFDGLNESCAIVHCISADAKMGAGFAKIVRSKYGKPSHISPLKVGTCLSQKTLDQTIFHLITKEKYFQKPTQETMFLALFDLRMELDEFLHIKTLMMPKIGCGLDKMCWEKDVEPLLQEIFSDWNGKILVFSL